MPMKAILLAGGLGSRLAPFTAYTQKTLLPIYKHPVIDYALATIRRAGIKDITIVANQFIGQIASHVGQGLPGERIHYVVEEEAMGVANALSLARPYNEDTRLMVYFSDNITTVEFNDQVGRFNEAPSAPGCVLLGREVEDPRAFGVAVFDENGDLVDLVEKPENPPSNIAIGGIYLFDETFWHRFDTAVKERGSSFSISDVNRSYVRDGQASVLTTGASAWIDCGTPETLLKAAIAAEQGILNPYSNQE
ncbi:MAG: hypothetical protein CMA86_00445 [Euryarchaeota archaeon]|nr:hypothetical protein [Euryarchaeota archaeon]|tara:strand:+ start:283 stop:1032 length:750 start_codon:yes stop_codon:yes gene_type:complete